MELAGPLPKAGRWRLALAALSLACAPPAPPGPEPDSLSEPTSATFVAEDQQSHTQARLQAISALDARVVWASGLEATYTRTADGGVTWHTARMPGAEELQFRDVHAVSADTAYLLAAGAGELSRIFKTTNGGADWQLQYLNPEPEGFLDCFDFWSPDRGIAYGDSVGGELFVLTTDDGETWSRVPVEALPDAGPGEGGFAASGGCVQTGSNGRAWIATGAGGAARVLRTADYGRSWAFAEAPVVRGEAAGLTTIAFHDDITGIALGGDLEQDDTFTANVALSADGGATWTHGGAVSFPGGIYGGAWSQDGETLIAAGPSGISVSSNGGRAWRPLSDRDTWSVAFGDADIFWAVGPEGRITRYSR